MNDVPQPSTWRVLAGSVWAPLHQPVDAMSQVGHLSGEQLHDIGPKGRESILRDVEQLQKIRLEVAEAAIHVSTTLVEVSQLRPR
jgi:hypothetical protein